MSPDDQRPEAGEPAEAPSRWQRLLDSRPVPRWVLLVLLGVLALPLAVALVALRRPTWFPVLDLAMTELRVRDVGGPDTPLIGLPGRIGTLDRQGSHPGPLSFYLLTPAYRLLGSSAWALQAATVVVNLVAMGVSLVVARRHGGVRAVLAVAAVLAVLSTAYGLSVLTEPWNPYLPLLWWVAFLIAAWAVSVGDWPMLPVAAFAASVCAQTHLPYLGLAGVLGLVAVAIGAATTLRSSEQRRRAWRGGLAAVAVVGVLWAPVVADQLAREPGNITLLREHMFDPPEEPVGLRTGARVVLVHLDLSQLFRSAEGGSGSLVDTSYDPYGAVLPGLVLAVAWAATAVLAWRRRLTRVLRLHGIVAVGLVLAVYSTSRVFGKLWYYLTLWAWALGVLALAAAVWTVVLVLERRRGQDAARIRRASIAVLAAAVLVPVAVLTAQAPGIDPPAPHLSEGLAAVVEPTADALRQGVGAASGPDGRYAVSWTDALYIGSQGYGLVSELERRGLDAGGMPWASVPITSHRAIEPEDATAVVHFASGPFIDDWRARPEVVEVVHVDPRDAAEREEYERLRARVLADLRAAGLEDVVPLVDLNTFGASLDPRLDEATQDRLERMLDLGLPISVFIAPPEVAAA